MKEVRQLFGRKGVENGQKLSERMFFLYFALFQKVHKETSKAFFTANSQKATHTRQPY